MATQTKAMQRKILDGAKAKGELDQLAWFVEMKMRLDHVGAAWPGNLVPVVPVGDDPEVSRAWAEILTALFEDANRGRGLEFTPALTTWDVLNQGTPWYLFEAWAGADRVCPGCGAIGEDCLAIHELCFRFQIRRIEPCQLT